MWGVTAHCAVVTTENPAFREKLPTGDVVTLILFAAARWLGFAFPSPFWKLIDLRIIIAPHLRPSLRGRGVQLEAGKKKNLAATGNTSE